MQNSANAEFGAVQNCVNHCKSCRIPDLENFCNLIVYLQNPHRYSRKRAHASLLYDSTHQQAFRFPDKRMPTETPLLGVLIESFDYQLL